MFRGPLRILHLLTSHQILAIWFLFHILRGFDHHLMCSAIMIRPNSSLTLTSKRREVGNLSLWRSFFVGNMDTIMAYPQTLQTTATMARIAKPLLEWVMLIHVFFQQFQTNHNLWVSETLYQSTALFHMFSICFPFFAIVSIFSIFVHHLSIMFHMFSIFFNINHPCFHLIPGILPCPGPKLLPQRVQDMLGEVRLPPVSLETLWSIWPSGFIMVNICLMWLIYC